MTDESIRQQIRQQHAPIKSPFAGSGPTSVDSPHLSNPVSSLEPSPREYGAGGTYFPRSTSYSTPASEPFGDRQELATPGPSQQLPKRHRRTKSLEPNFLSDGGTPRLGRLSNYTRSGSIQAAVKRLGLHRGSQQTDPWAALNAGSPDDAGGQDTRRIRLGQGAVNEGYVGNSIRTAKYNIITFLPFFLWTMIKRVAYLYFFFQAALAWWSTVSPFSPFGPTIALLFVLLVAAVKAAIEDKKRHREDRITNNSIAHVVNPDGSVKDIKWHEVHVGMVLEVRDNENIPADLLCLHCTHTDNVCFIKTVNLDGESNLKIRRPVDIKGDMPKSAVEAKQLLGVLSCETPNPDLHNFIGNFSYRPSSGHEVMKVPVTINEILLRGCTLKNSGCAHGVVVYTGPESRIQMNAAEPPRKVGAFDRFLNVQITLVLVFQLSICLAFAIASWVWRQTRGYDNWYLALNVYTSGNYQNAIVYIIILFITFWILFSYLVPISLFVSIEIVKFVLCSVFIVFDPHMREGPDGEPARARNSDIVEDLGMVEYVFSDKTGTLTSNEMQLRMLAVKGRPFGRPDFRLEDMASDEPSSNLAEYDGRLAAAVDAVQHAGLWKDLLESGGSSADILARAEPSEHQSGEASGALENGVAPDHEEGLRARYAAQNLAQPSNGDLEATASAPGHDRETGSSDADGSSAEDQRLLGQQTLDFWMNLCLCHTLIVEEGEKGDPPIYQGPSPDEVALVEGGRLLGFEFVARDRASLTVRMQGHESVHQVLNVLDFTSDRACMSIIVRAPNGVIRLHSKGSDAALLPRLAPDTDAALLKRTQKNLHDFSVKGLRTLVLASRKLDNEEWARWNKGYQEAAASLEGREARIAAEARKVETDLQLVGVTAIEDKLQDGVPEAIQTLVTAGIKVWMITGDKQETAINIAIACKLVHHPDSLIVINAADSNEAARARLEEALQHCRECHAASAGAAAEMVVDGRTLSRILGTDAEPLLAELANCCSGVVVCRASPSQKAAIVHMMKRFQAAQASSGSKGGAVRAVLPTSWLGRIRRHAAASVSRRMLAVGDGANDVAMIQAADIGVGVMGKEGRQAVNNADFAFSQFRFLTRLLLVHGTLADYRLQRLIKYSFYKNITFAFMFFFYQAFNGVSGQAWLDGVTAAFYNAFFTAGPVLCFALFDRPVRHLSTLMEYPQLYNRKRPLTSRTFWKTGVLTAITHAAVLFFIPYLSLTTNAEKPIDSVYAMGKLMFIGIIGVVSWEIALISRYWTWLFILVWFLSYFVTFPFLLALGALFERIGYYDISHIGVALRIFSTPGFWMELVAVYIITFSLRYMERAVRWLFFPNDDMILAEVEAAAAARRRKASKTPQRGANNGECNDSDIDRDAPCMA
ncbi:probable phospholipid-transporting ATPase 7 [Coccomyxa sp. Obi]|nr:probable phospholipid-transporting ATPase 7 [Coccomyxa sp. Obi]